MVGIASMKLPLLEFDFESEVCCEGIGFPFCVID